MGSTSGKTLKRSNREQAVADIYFSWKEDQRKRHWKAFLKDHAWHWSNPNLSTSMQKNAKMDFQRQMEQMEAYNAGNKLYSK